MLGNLLENSKEKIIKLAMDKYLPEGHISLIAWLDDDGEPKAKTFDFSIRKKIEKLQKENKELFEQKKERDKINHDLLEKIEILNSELRKKDLMYTDCLIELNSIK